MKRGVIVFLISVFLCGMALPTAKGCPACSDVIERPETMSGGGPLRAGLTSTELAYSWTVILLMLCPLGVCAYFVSDILKTIKQESGSSDGKPR